MNFIDLILLIVVITIVINAIIFLKKQKAKGKCCGCEHKKTCDNAKLGLQIIEKNCNN